MTVINTNTSALRAQNGSRMANQMLQTAMARLSSGKRINSASDDAAGLAISNSMTSQITGMNQAIRNANDGISLAQTADGALDEATNILQRIRELAVQSASGTYQNSDRNDMQTEVDELKKQLVNIAQTTYNGVSLFSATADKTVSIQAGANSTDQVKLTISKLNLVPVSGSVTSGTTTAGLGGALAANDPLVGTSHVITAEDVAYGATIAGATPTSADIGNTATLATADKIYVPAGSDSVAGGVTITSDVSAQNSLTTIDTALQALATTRASIGAGESRLNSVVNNLTNNVTNLTDARSRIQDADFSAETTSLAKAQILSQAATAMLAQANQSQQGVLKLLQ